MKLVVVACLVAFVLGIMEVAGNDESRRLMSGSNAQPKPIDSWVRWFLRHSKQGHSKNSKSLHRSDFPMMQKFVASPGQSDEELTGGEDFDDLLLPEGQQNPSKRQPDDYGHMRFGKRDFDDYGHMRFGR